MIESCEGVCLLCVESEASSVYVLLLCVYVYLCECVRDTIDLYCRETSTHTGNSKTRVPRRWEHCLPFSLYIHTSSDVITHSFTSV